MVTYMITDFSEETLKLMFHEVLSGVPSKDLADLGLRLDVQQGVPRIYNEKPWWNVVSYLFQFDKDGPGYVFIVHEHLDACLKAIGEIISGPDKALVNILQDYLCDAPGGLVEALYLGILIGEVDTIKIPARLSAMFKVDDTRGSAYSKPRPEFEEVLKRCLGAAISQL